MSPKSTGEPEPQGGIEGVLCVCVHVCVRILCSGGAVLYIIGSLSASLDARSISVPQP